MREAMFLSGLTYNPQYSIMKNDSEPYDPDSLADILKTFSEIPDCFVAANDSIAISLLSALKKLGIAVPQKVKIVSLTMYLKQENSPCLLLQLKKTSLAKKLYLCFRSYCKSYAV
jgi:DNA-binding LacI/PurR family transcriptional regulator